MEWIYIQIDQHDQILAISLTLLNITKCLEMGIYKAKIVVLWFIINFLKFLVYKNRYNQLILDGVRLFKVYTHLYGNIEFEYDKTDLNKWGDEWQFNSLVLFRFIFEYMLAIFFFSCMLAHYRSRMLGILIKATSWKTLEMKIWEIQYKSINHSTVRFLLNA